MFLAELTKDGHSAFLNLAVAIIKADGKVTQDELNTLNMYKAEITGMRDISEYGSDDIKGDINFFAELDLQTRKKVYFELISLAYTDSDYSDDEMYNILIAMAKQYGFTVDPNVLIPFKSRIQKERSLISFGNGRTVRNLLDEILDKHAYNYQTHLIPKECKFTICDIDVNPNLNENSF